MDKRKLYGSFYIDDRMKEEKKNNSYKKGYQYNRNINTNADQKNISKSGADSTFSKSIETQTNESSFLLTTPCACDRYNLTSDDSMQQHQFFNQNVNPNLIWKTPDCIPLCPLCGSSLVSSNYKNSAHCQLCHSSPWHQQSLYSQCNNGCVPPLGIPPFIPVAVLPGSIPCNNNCMNSTQGLHCTSSRTNVNRSTGNNLQRDSLTSLVENENISNIFESPLGSVSVGVSDDCKGQVWNRSKLKTASIRSEPSVVVKSNTICSDNNYKIANNIGSNSKITNKKIYNKREKFDKNISTNLLSKNIHKKPYYKSDTDLPVGLLCAKSKNIDVRDQCKDTHYTNIIDNIGCSSKDGAYVSHRIDKNCCNFSYNNRRDNGESIIYSKNRELKSPIYKYADIRIHELSSSLKNIKENIYKLSTKASELNVCEPGCDDDSGFNKYFKNVCDEFNDGGDASVLGFDVDNTSKKCIKNVLDLSFCISNSKDTQDNNNNNSKVEVKSVKNFVDCRSPLSSSALKCSKEIDELFTNCNSMRGSNSFNNISTIKRTVPLHNISSALNQSDDSLYVPVKIKSEFLSKTNEIKDKFNYGDRPSRRKVHTIEDDNLSHFRGCKEDSKSEYKKEFKKLSFSGDSKRKLNLSRSDRSTNLSLKLNFDSFIEKDDFVINPVRNKFSLPIDGMIGNRICRNDLKNTDSNEKRVSKSFFQVNVDDFRKYKLLSHDYNNNAYNNDHNGNVNYNETDIVGAEDDGSDEIIAEGDCEEKEINDVVDFALESKEKSVTSVVSSQQNMANIESWLEGNVDTKQQNENDCNGQISQNRQQSQFNSLNNLEVLSKISEEDEDRFSSISEGSDHLKYYSIRDKVYRNSNADKRKKKVANVGEKISGLKGTQIFIGKSFFREMN